MSQDQHPSDDELETRAEGDDAFGGAVGDSLPGGVQPPAGGGKPTRERTAAAYGVEQSTEPTYGGAPQDENGEPVDMTAFETAYADGAPSAGGDSGPSGVAADPSAEPTTGGSADAVLAAERLADLQRLQAEYVNYKKRVDRDRETQRELTISSVVESLLPVMDEIHLARQHGELEGGPFAKIAEKFEGILAKHGVVRFGEEGETFDPMVHQALMHTEADLPAGTTETTVVTVMQPGYKIGERVVRPAMVAVADPR